MKIGEYYVQMDLSVNETPTNESSIAGAYSEKSETHTPKHQHCQHNCDKCHKQKICEKSPAPVPLKLDLSNYVRSILSFEKQINHIKPSSASQLPQTYSQGTWASPITFLSSQLPQTYSRGTWASPITFSSSQLPQTYSQGTWASPITFLSSQLPQTYSRGTWVSPITFSSSQLPQTYFRGNWTSPITFSLSQLPQTYS